MPSCSLRLLSAALRTACNSLGLPFASQLANLHHPPRTAPAPLTSPQRTGSGMGGQLAQRPPSSATVRSTLSRKKGTTSNVPLTLFLPQFMSVSPATAPAKLSRAGADGCVARDASRVTSWCRCCSRGARRAERRWRRGPGE